jgi:hypothetical protein
LTRLRGRNPLRRGEGPRIHRLRDARCRWIAGSSPAMTRAKNKSAAPWVCRVGLSRKFRRSATTCRIARPRWSIARQACRAGRPAHNCPRTINRRCDLPLTPPALSRPGSARRAGIAPPAIPPDNPAAWVAAPANQACAQDRREGPQLRRTQAGRSRSAQLSLESPAMRLQGSSRRSVTPLHDNRRGHAEGAMVLRSVCRPAVLVFQCAMVFAPDES